MSKIFSILIIILLAIIIGALAYFFYPLPSEKETVLVKVFFSNSDEDPKGLFCNKVYFAEREVAKTEFSARTALEELLKGPTDMEKEGWFFTNINPGVSIQNLNIENGKAMVDFDKTLEQEVGGSCRVSAIRAQITETLKQFSEIEEVIISIDSRTEDILQP
jgi:spore germination protein GerM